MSVPWIKLRTDIFDDEKIKIIDTLPEHDAILVVWIKLLALAGKCNSSGVLLISDTIPYTEETLAAVFSRPLSTIRLALESFERLGMIEKEQSIKLVNWEKHQNEAALEIIRERERTRKAMQRNNLKALPCPGSVPDKSRKVRPLDIDKELDKDKEKKRKIKTFTPPTLEEVETYVLEKALCIIPFKFIDWYSKTDWKDKDGKQITNWKNKLLNWDSREKEKNPAAKPYSKPIPQAPIYSPKCPICGATLVGGEYCRKCEKYFDSTGKEVRDEVCK